MLDEDARGELLTLGKPQPYEPGAILIRQGDSRCDHVLLLRSARPGTSACAKVTVALGNGAEALLGVRVSGDLVGEMAVLRGTDRSATVTACTPMLAFQISSAAFISYLDGHPRLWSALASMIANRLDWANHRRLDFAAFPIPVRLARVLTDLAASHGFPVEEGTDLGVGLSQPELGRLIGAREAAVNNAVRSFKENGLLLIRRRRLIITDPEGLRAFGTEG
ncbi:Crp/Fnr family transcriptional regulator [Planomonospora parontospora]|uniref:Crp/Fnr family transcriptional regulator n=1 Tax=Planomonospora parontospora TaxID=58119 RepID=UPI001670C4E1|nr:Crp/Fnr family transcriptional regulator [Planomonospora parontospora]GGL28127.1 Crp/Fnr family transcriptional regulator [Planomonospora parontospora subsp. antibiotica]GII20107.1 Crp/Fnr family transcriptional regulator [Planomonospora parontospora subsp. antibiotica]